MIDADHEAHTLSNKVNRLGKSEPSRLGWLSIGSKAARDDQDRERHLDPAGRQGRATPRRLTRSARHRAGARRRRLRPRHPRRPGDAARRPPTASCSTTPTRIVAVLPTNLDINDAHGRDHRRARPAPAQARRRDPRTNSRPPPSERGSEAAHMLERRQNPLGRAATASVPRITLGGLAARRARSRADREFHDRDGRSRIAGSAVRCI